MPAKGQLHEGKYNMWNQCQMLIPGGHDFKVRRIYKPSAILDIFTNFAILYMHVLLDYGPRGLSMCLSSTLKNMV